MATLKKTKIVFQDQVSLNERESKILQNAQAILSRFVFEWPFYTGFNVYDKNKVGHHFHILS